MNCASLRGKPFISNVVFILWQMEQHTAELYLEFDQRRKEQGTRETDTEDDAELKDRQKV